MGGKQLGISDYELTTAKKQTKREKFLAWLPDAVVIVSTKRLPSGLKKLVVFWPSG